MSQATFRFHAELNNFLPPERRRCEFGVSCARSATTKHMIEALGVPVCTLAQVEALENGRVALTQP